MSNAIEQLRASRLEADTKACGQGRASGRTWALEDGEAVELQRIEALHGRCAERWEQWFTSDRDDAYSVAELFAREVLDDALAGRDEMADFWERAISPEHAERTCEDAFVRGFAEGALEVWDEVKGRH